MSTLPAEGVGLGGNMPLLAFNMTAAPLALAAGTPTVTLPATAVPGSRGPAVNVTSELWPNAAVDPTRGRTGGVDAAGYTALQAQVTATDIELEWTADAEYQTGALTPGGPTPGPHASSHVPGASDAITTAAAGAVQIGDSAAEGSASSLARSDHTHSVAAPGAPADVTKDAAATGSSSSPARADHKHDVSTASPGAIQVGASAAEGSATSLARSDHTHSLAAPAAPADVTKAAADTGSATSPARADHKHDVSTGVPSSTSTANAEGSATSLARSDHEHAIGTGTLTPAHDNITDPNGLGAASIIRVAFPPGGGGVPDDVPVYVANAPFGFRVVDALIMVAVPVALSTVTVRDAPGGGGAALSDAFDTSTPGTKRNALLTGSGLVPPAGTLMFNRSDNGVGGEITLHIQKV